MKFLFEWSGPALGHKAVVISEMNIAELRAFMADIRVRQAKLDAQMLEANARMISLMHDPVAPTFVIPERELVAHGGLTSREAREVVSRGLVTEAAPEMASVLAAGNTTAAHVDALGRGLKIAGAEREAFMAHLPELVEAATTMSAFEFGQLVTETAKSVVTDDGLSTFERQKRETFFKMRGSDVVGNVARRLLADLQPDTADSVVRELVAQASDVVDRRQAAPHSQQRFELDSEIAIERTA